MYNGLSLEVNTFMPRHQNAGQNHNVNAANKSFEDLAKCRNESKKSIFHSQRNCEQIKFGERLLPFGAESFVFPFPVYIHKH